MAHSRRKRVARLCARLWRWERRQARSPRRIPQFFMNAVQDIFLARLGIETLLGEPLFPGLIYRSPPALSKERA